MLKKILLSSILVLHISVAMSQRTTGQLNLRGSILGYHFDPNTGLFKKDKFEIIGSISSAKITLLKDGKKVKTTTTSSGGDFSLGIPVGFAFTIKYTKDGYATSAVKINLENIPDDLVKSGLILQNLEFLLNDHKSETDIDLGKPFGTINFNSSQRKFEFTPVIFDKKNRLFKKPEDSAPVNLMQASIKKNSENNKKVIQTQVSDNGEVIIVDDPNLEVGESEGSNISKETRKLTLESSSSLQKIVEWKHLTKADLENRANQIDDAWKQLEEDKLIAVTPEDFLIIQAREELLIAAEKELEAAKQYMSEQQDKLAAQQNFNYVLIGLAIILAAFAFVLFKRSKEKQAANEQLAAKNKKITDSINYAERIQKSLLLSKSQIAAFLPNAFVFHQPLNIVSGDFYWFSEVNGKVVFAAVDCTGHGVPGAFMSLIGNTLLNKIVNEDKILSPSKILSELHCGVVLALQQDKDTEAAQDGMDMAICVFDKATKKVSFAGAQNPIYIVQNNELKEFSGYMLGIGGKHRKLKANEINFPEETIQLNSGDQVYLFSDGFMDQFGGPDNEKFNLTNFRNLLLDLSLKDIKEQEEIAKNTFENWRGNSPQLDDVLLIGCKF